MRKANNSNFNEYRRTEFHNPLFNLITGSFDSELLERGLSDEYVLENLYVDSRTEQNIVREKLFTLWTRETKMINKSSDVHKAIKNNGLVYLLLGKKGTGKTITLKRIVHDIQKQTKDERTLHTIHLNLMTKKSDMTFIDDAPNSLMVAVYETIKSNISGCEHLRPYITDIEMARHLDETYNHLDNNALAQRLLDKKTEVIANLFRFLKKGHTTYLIVDNIDDFPIRAISAIIDKCIEFMHDFSIKCIIALRDYWNPNNLNVDDTNICSCYLTKPNIFKILERRLSMIPLDDIKNGYTIMYGRHTIELTVDEIRDTFIRIAKYITSESTIHEKLYRLANYDTREHLFNIYNFFHSPYLYSKPMFVQVLIDKIIEAEGKTRDKIRKTQFFDFIECAMAIHSLCFDRSASKIFNIFFHKYNYGDDYDYRNTLIYIRILQVLSVMHVEKKEEVIEKLKRVGYSEVALRNAIDVLLKYSLIESVQGVKEVHAEELFVSDKGNVYLDDLIYEYTYLLFICDDVPMPPQYQESILEKFGNEDIPLNRGNLHVKNESVLKFMRFIRREEENEKNKCSEKYQGLLERIRGEEGIVSRMEECVDSTVEKLTKSGRSFSHRIETVKITPN